MNKVEKTDAQWREQLGEMEYKVTRCAATEYPGTGQYTDHFEEGTYICVCCDLPLFSSDDKFRAHCGWPSFTAPVEDANVSERADRTHNMVRVETLCTQCDAHLGHVFEDGPAPTGLRYCINSAALKFVPA